jgi:hypothetical protein
MAAKRAKEERMIGKKNVVFGFLYLVLTAALGPYMVIQGEGLERFQDSKQQALSGLQQLEASNFEKNLEPLGAEQIAKTNTRALLALNDYLNAEAPIDAIKGGPHAHGNLEALLNIALGVVLCFVAAAYWFKQLVSWMFIAGTLLHSGMLYLAVVFHLGWAGVVLGTGIGPILILTGLALAGIAAAAGFQGRPVQEG